VVLAFDGMAVEDYRHLQRLVAESKVGKVVTLEILRDKKRIEVSATVAETPPDGTRSGGPAPG
jgi:S1-C subfamily serine protease